METKGGGVATDSALTSHFTSLNRLKIFFPDFCLFSRPPGAQYALESVIKIDDLK